MNQTDKCDGIDPDLQAGTTIKGASEISSSTKFNPQKIGGFRPNEGDTHGAKILEVPDCTE
jgi:hypothetical protein